MIDLFNKSSIRLKKNNNIGNIQYKGCKRKISYELLEQMHTIKPQASLFIDLFGGCGAMSFRALDMGYKVIYNELSNDIYRFFKFVITQAADKTKYSKYGILPDEYYNFVGKDEFFKSKNKENKSVKDIFNLLFYSFGNSLSNYAFTKLEEFKKQGHDMILFNKPAPVYRDRYSFLEKHIISLEQLKMPWRDKRLYFVNIVLKLEAISVSLLYNDSVLNDFKGLSFEEFKALRNKDIVDSINNHLILKGVKIPFKDYDNKVFFVLKQLQQLQRLEQLQQLEQLEQLQRLEQLQQLQRLEQLEQLTIFNKSYDAIDLSTLNNKDVIIYCDIPYRNTSKYQKDGFDYDKFENWLLKMRQKGFDVFVSEYTQPANTTKIFEIKKEKVFNSTKNKSFVNECLFVN